MQLLLKIWIEMHPLLKLNGDCNEFYVYVRIKLETDE